MRPYRSAVALAIVALTSTSHSEAWDAGGHRITAFEAVGLLAGELPEFLQSNPEQIARAALDPDLMRVPTLAHLRDRESPDHYLDLELLEGTQLPETRSEFLELIASKEIGARVDEIGSLPFAVVEATERLTLAFAQVRHQPTNEHLRAKVGIYVGHLAHYATDLCQPLHTTIHHDGRALQNGESPQTGIHVQVDALIERLRPQDSFREEPLRPTLLAPLLPAVVDELERSHAEVERVYRLEADLKVLEAGGEPSAGLQSLTRDRYRAATLFTANLILTAWQESADLQIPRWGLPEQAPTN